MLKYVTVYTEDGWWGIDQFEDEAGNQYLITADFRATEGHPYRVSDKEANAIAAELGAK